MRGQLNAAKPPSSAQTGWSVWRKSSVFAGLTTPSAPLKEASRLLLDVASTPPVSGGEWRTRTYSFTPAYTHLPELLHVFCNSLMSGGEFAQERMRQLRNSTSQRLPHILCISNRVTP